MPPGRQHRPVTQPPDLNRHQKHPATGHRHQPQSVPILIRSVCLRVYPPGWPFLGPVRPKDPQGVHGDEGTRQHQDRRIERSSRQVSRATRTPPHRQGSASRLNSTTGLRMAGIAQDSPGQMTAAFQREFSERPGDTASARSGPGENWPTPA